METKLFEVLDRATFIPVVGVLMKPPNPIEKDRLTKVQQRERYLIRQAGYGYEPPHCVLLSPISKPNCQAGYDPYSWKPPYDRTMAVAHQHITDKWDELESGAVIDVEFILGETTQRKLSEQDVAI